MPKLPDREDAPQARIYGPSAVQTPSMSIASGNAAAARRMGSAIAGAGREIAGALEAREKEEEKLQLLELDAEWQEKMTSFDRSFNDDNDYKTYDERWKAGSEEITKGIADRIKDPKLRKEFAIRKGMRASNMGQRLYQRGERLREEENIGRVSKSVESAVGIASDPESSPAAREQARIDINSRIQFAEEQGVITPGKAQELRDKFAKTVRRQDVQNRLAKDPTSVLEELSLYEKELAAGKSARQGANDLEITRWDGERRTGRPRSKPVRGIIAHYTEGGTNMDGLADWANKSNTGYHYYIDREGRVIEFAGDDIVMNHAGEGRRRPGDRAPHLGNGNSVGIGIMTPKGGKATPAQIEAFRKLSGRLAEKYGLSTKDIFGHGEVAVGHRQSTEAMDAVDAVRKEGFATAQAPQELPETDDRGDEGVGDMPAQEIIRREQIADTYDALSPEDRYKIRAEAERAIKVRTAAAQQEIKKQRQSDIDSIKFDGVPLEGFNPAGLPDDLRQRHERDRKMAFVYHGLTRDVASMSAAEMENNLVELTKQRKDMAGKPEAADLRKLHEDIEKRYKEVQEERSKDPAEAVKNTPEVAAFYQRNNVAEMNAGGLETMEAWEDLIEVRKQAQADIGIPANDQRILTQQEALALIPDLRSEDPRAIKDVLAEAVQVAQNRYGQYAKAALMEGLRARKLISAEDGRYTNMIRRGLGEAGFSARDLRRLDMESQIMGEMAAGGGFMEDPRTVARDIYGQTAEQRAPDAIGRPTPTVSQYEWAKSRGPDGARLYDQEFGAGAFEQSRKYLEGGN